MSDVLRRLHDWALANASLRWWVLCLFLVAAIGCMIFLYLVMYSQPPSR